MMTQTPNPLQAALDHLEKIQIEHLIAFGSCDPYDRIYDAAQQNFERARAVEELKHQLQVFLKDKGEGSGDGRLADDVCQDRITTLIAREAVLMERLTARRLCLKKEIKRLLKGKRALFGYSLAARNGRPFHVSDQG